MKFLIYSFVCCIGLVHCSFGNENLLGHDIRLFKDTPVWELAKAVKSQDTLKIKEILSKQEINVDFQEPKFGETLLIQAVYNQWIHSVRILLESGANPNLPDNYDSSNAIIEASGWGPDYEDDPELLKLVLRYGGDPNYIQVPKRKDNPERNTPLIIAAQCSLIKTKILLEAGADINYVSSNYESALRSASLGNKGAPEMLKYLLENGADCNTIMLITIHGEKVMLVDFLRNWLYPLDSKKYQIKMEIVEILKKCGQDYWNTPVPKHYYKNYDSTYLKKY